MSAMAAMILLASAGWAQETKADAEALDAAVNAIEDTLHEADAAVADAAEDIGRTGLRGRRAHARLQALCEDLTYASNCSVVNADGVLVTEAPAAFTGVEGRDVSEQAHVQKLLRTREPVLGEAFRSVEGFDAVILAHPVFGPRDRFLGFVSIMARPGSLVGHAVKPVLTEGAPEVYVVQTDGTILYDQDADEIGRNVLTDPMYEPYGELRDLVRRQRTEREGTGDYRFLGRGFTPPVVKRSSWDTAELHGTEWRVAVTRSVEDGGPPVARYDEPAIPIPAEVGLSSLVSLTEAHLNDIADDFALIASQAEVRSGDWAQIEAPLRRVSERNLDAVYWFAEPDGSYWTLDGGRADASLSDRPYFPKAVAGERVVGDLVASKATGRTTGIVAVPVKGDDGEIVGVLGASVYLEQLSAILRDEMGLDEGLWFYAFDEDQRLALHPDPKRVFLTAGELGPEVEQWFTEMQERGQGVMRYTYEDQPRTLVFTRSPTTGWTYAFGYVGEREPGA